MEGFLDIDHVLHSLRVGTGGHEKRTEGSILDLQEFYNAFGA